MNFLLKKKYLNYYSHDEMELRLYNISFNIFFNLK